MPERPEAPVHRRGRTAALIASAAALGVVAGVCTGYLVQANRPPTKLPSLSQPAVRQAHGDVAVLTAAQDRRVKTDGDLRKLLLQRPRAARATAFTDSDGWMDLADYADAFDNPAQAFGRQLGDDFRRAAVTSWHIGTYSVEIRLVQYREEVKLAASQHVEDQQYWSERRPDTDSRAVPGTGDGMVWVHHRPDTEPGYLPMYQAEALASRGDLVMEIWVTDTRPVPEKKIMDLAKRQVSRL
ncbi:hypothetical protein AB0E10_05935 [Streptomyces sp. NPDC048045]|uniref:hypothetical protein n=1 Tax=Streptomyces sp. NPDC048045 TaxID=3154710 RepID=UPI003413E08A